ncbi:MAG TPA: orotidine-5'-phosphate decarboxylase [Thermoanaerobaculia bacterium]|nr:orotidine-5'-phosphate decarboxylase [Thermoanaerobaculia bacterium]
MEPRDRLVVAVDRSSRQEILALVDALHGLAGVFKIGLQAFIVNGPDIVREIVGRGERVFLDLKIHDIPHTAKRAVAEVAALDVSLLTVHASGGPSMLAACAEGIVDSARPPLVLGVTILTSLDEAELESIGFHNDAIDNAVRLARVVRHAGLAGVVASPLEIGAIRDACGSDFVILTPGIRPAGSAAGDQRRTLSPGRAIAEGADYLVVGRPITDAPSPRDAALAILDEIAAA